MAQLKDSLTLPVLWNTESSMELQNLGIETDEHIIKKITFYSIDHVYEYEYKGNTYTKVCSGGVEFIVQDNINTINHAIISKLT